MTAETTTNGKLLLALLDEFDCGLLVCDEHARLHYTNRAADERLRHSGTLACVGGRLVRAEAIAGGLEEAVLAAARRGRRGLVELVHGDERTLLVVQPLPAACGEGLVLLMIGAGTACSALGLEMLGSRYGLTLAERRVLAALVQQSRPREIAEQLSIAITTVRSHIAALRSKFGVRSIEGLLLRAAQVPPVTPAWRAGAASTPAWAALGTAAS